MVPSRSDWSIDRSAELYNLPGWGAPYFAIDEEGRVRVSPDGEGLGASLTDVVAVAAERGLSLPLLVRFDGILGHRVQVLTRAFAAAREEAGFGGRYRPVYPIKVNQERQVVEGLLRDGPGVAPGLEVGSKPELMAVVALLQEPSLIICNGYKDDTYIELACLAVRLGHEVVVVIEKPSEIETVQRVVGDEGREACPVLGLRSRLLSRGEGRWKGSAGDRAKFGLSSAQLVEAVDWLREVDLLDRLRLLHFHIGSQISAIRPMKAALREAARLYVEIAALGAPLGLFDVGGGLAVDYDGSATNYHSSKNYSEQEYANDVVWAIQDATAKAGLPAPDIITESGRALAAHHAVILVEVTGTSRLTGDGEAPPRGDGEPEILGEFRETLERLNRRTVAEAYHDALSLREDLQQRFVLGLIDLRGRATGEQLFFAIMERAAGLLDELDEVPEELAALRRSLADIYFCNFSVFQSIPDHWAIRQVFPVVPIHRLDEQPSVLAVLGDMTCDSDGKVDRFPDRRDVKDVLEVHPLREGERYVLGIFLAGAYQEILGDLHNLFGDTDAVHVEVDGQGRPQISDAVQGETVGEVLSYVGYDEQWLMGRYDRALDRLVAAGSLTRAEADEVREDLVANLAGNTYLTVGSVKTVRRDDLAEEEDGEPAPVPATATPEPAP